MPRLAPRSESMVYAAEYSAWAVAFWAVLSLALIVCTLWLLTDPDTEKTKTQSICDISSADDGVSSLRAQGSGSLLRTTAASHRSGRRLSDVDCGEAVALPSSPDTARRVVHHSVLPGRESVDISGTTITLQTADVRSERHQSAGRTHAWYCLLGVLFGVVGFCLTLISATADVCANPDGTQKEGVLPRWPSTVSEINSDFNSGRGRLFFGFMLATSGFLYLSHMPNCLDTPNFENDELDVDGDGETQGCCGFETRPIDPTERYCCERLVPTPCKRARVCMAWVPRATCCDRFLRHFRALTVPVGALFVALCPTVNFWTQHQAGVGIVKVVHLVAAGFLFVGGTVTELIRLYNLYAKWRTKAAPSAKWSRTHFLLNEPVRMPGKQLRKPLGPVRPFIILCLLINMSILIPDLIQDNGCKIKGDTGECDPIVARRGEVITSPVGTAYCPGKDYSYANISSLFECETVTRKLSEPYVELERDFRWAPHGKVWAQSSPSDTSSGNLLTTTSNNSSQACFVDFAEMDSVGIGQRIMNGSACALSNFNLNTSQCESPPGLWCGNKIVLPRVVALCVCAPEDDESTECRYDNTKKSSLRLRIFILEGSLVIMLLLNYATIALEHSIDEIEEIILKQIDADFDFDYAQEEKDTFWFPRWQFYCYFKFLTATRILTGVTFVLVSGLLHELHPLSALSRTTSTVEQFAAPFLAALILATLGAAWYIADRRKQPKIVHSVLKVLRAFVMVGLFLAIQLAFAAFLNIRAEQEGMLGSVTSTVTGWRYDNTVVALLLSAAGLLGGEDWRFGLAFWIQMCVGFAIMVVVVADAAHQADAAAGGCCCSCFQGDCWKGVRGGLSGMAPAKARAVPEPEPEPEPEP